MKKIKTIFKDLKVYQGKKFDDKFLKYDYIGAPWVNRNVGNGGFSFRNKNIMIKGFAWSGNGNNIVRVDISFDEGSTWIEAELTEGYDQPIARAWAWTFWELSIPIPEIKKGTTIVCKATDIHYNTQPETIHSIWNLRGILNNSWHRIIL